MEKKLQAEIIKWLRTSGCYVIKTKPGPGTPVGCPDIVFLHNKWGVIECKADEKSKMQPGQPQTLEFLRGFSNHVYKVWPGNWPEVKALLQRDFF